MLSQSIHFEFWVLSCINVIHQFSAWFELGYVSIGFSKLYFHYI